MANVGIDHLISGHEEAKKATELEPFEGGLNLPDGKPHQNRMIPEFPPSLLENMEISHQLVFSDRSPMKVSKPDEKPAK